MRLLQGLMRVAQLGGIGARLGFRAAERSGQFTQPTVEILALHLPGQLQAQTLLHLAAQRGVG
ncbi:MAG: hypothetical protein ACKODH_11570 [Limisphaerales bacterium]